MLIKMVDRIVLVALTFYLANIVVSAFTTSIIRNPIQQHWTDSVRHQRNEHLPLLQQQRQQHVLNFDCRLITSSKTRLCMSGIGIATNYTWKEDAYEIELSVRVPKATRTKDIRYKATSRSIDLRLLPVPKNSNASVEDDNFSNTEIVLLDGSRQLRGRINVDGTYWVISDLPNTVAITTMEDDDAQLKGPKENEQYRQVTVTIEKIIATPKDDFDIIDYDWKGIYHSEDENEVSVRTYDAPEPFNVRQYAAEMGVDIDNLNMSMVDKTMFSSNLNITKSTLQTLHKAGYISPQEVTQQKDGTEYIVNPETGEPELVSIDDEFRAPSAKIPFIDTDTAWDKERVPETEASPPESVSTTLDSPVPISAIPDNNNNRDDVVQLKRNLTRAAFVNDQMNPDTGNNNENPFRSSSGGNNKNDDDPIAMLTVVRLKEILKAQGLKTSGTKSELQQRLRQQVNALLQQQSLGE